MRAREGYSHVHAAAGVGVPVSVAEAAAAEARSGGGSTGVDSERGAAPEVAAGCYCVLRR
jgi:hypothetical protein